MKHLAFLLAFLLFAAPAWGAPFLVCAPSPDAITGVEVEITRSGVTEIVVGGYTVEGADAKLLDLVNFANGSYIFRARWWVTPEWKSEWSDPLNAVKSGKPGNFRIK